MSDTLERIAGLLATSYTVGHGNKDRILELIQQAEQSGIDATRIINDGLIPGMDRIGELFKANAIYVPEVLIATKTMKEMLDVLEPRLVASDYQQRGTVVIGTVAGDLHDIGKTLVGMMLSGAGYGVFDLGIDVEAENFSAAVATHNAQIVGLSALLTTTMPQMEPTIREVKSVIPGTKVIVGGAPVTQGYADQIGADGYAPDAVSAVDVVNRLMGFSPNRESS